VGHDPNGGVSNPGKSKTPLLSPKGKVRRSDREFFIVMEYGARSGAWITSLMKRALLS
jgi:hypothetical protein